MVDSLLAVRPGCQYVEVKARMMLADPVNAIFALDARRVAEVIA